MPIEQDAGRNRTGEFVERCAQCGWPLVEQAQCCSSCGAEVSQTNRQALDSSPPAAVQDAVAVGPQRPDSSAGPLPIPENIAGVIAYITIFPAIVFLLLEPFKRNRFVRFHSFQHLLLWAAGVGIGIAGGILGAILQLIPFMRVLFLPLGGLLSLAWFFLWLLLVVKAYYHEMFKLPYLGDLAEDWAQR
jgi:uncharacterized membrane protein